MSDNFLRIEEPPESETPEGNFPSAETETNPAPETAAADETPEAEARFELTPEEATRFDKHPPQETKEGGFFNRDKVLKILSVAFAVVIAGGFIFSTVKGTKKTSGEEVMDRAARAPREFLSEELRRAETAKPEINPGDEENAIPPSFDEDSPASSLPRPVFERTPPARQEAAPVSQNSASVPAYAGVSAGGGYEYVEPDPLVLAYGSPLVPRVEGGLFQAAANPASSPAMNPAASYASAYPAGYQEALAAAAARQAAPYAQPNDPYAQQNNQENKQGFYAASAGGEAPFGTFLGDNAVWIGTTIPGILITAINTDLPGNILARTTENIYDSRTGKNLLIPQGTTLVARYNSSVSYAQKRVQIVWDLLIRPDGLMLELEGAGGVDKKGGSGIKADYNENWFEYVKAAGIITMFSVANSRMAEEAARYGSNDMAAGAVSANAQFLSQTGSSIISRAMNIQPTLTVDNGSVINIMLNKTLYLPPLSDHPVKKRYVLQ